MKRSLVLVMILGMTISAAHAVIVASDNSGDAAYSDPFPQWDTGDNGGYGFGAWALSPDPNTGNAGFFTASATQNGSFPSGGAIDVGGDSWGLYGNNGNTAVAYRGFDFGVLGIGSTFSIGMDNGYVDGGSFVGFVLRSGNDTGNKNTGQRFEFAFQGGSANYLIFTNSAQPAIDTGVGYTDGGLQLDLTLLSMDTFSLRIITLATSATNYVNGTFGGTAGSGIGSVALYNQYAGSGQNYDLFFNNMEVNAVPEPSVLGLLLLGTGVWLVRRRRRSQ